MTSAVSEGLSRFAVDSEVTEAILDVQQVDLVRNGRHLLTDVSLTVRAGQHWAIIGPNGAGKSTLMTLLGAAGHPTRGSVHILGHRLGRVDTRQLRTMIGHVDPRHRLEADLTPREVVLTGLTNTTTLPPRFVPTAEDHAVATRLLHTLGMDDTRDHRWPTMSQGERGRALIARALMSSPRCLLLDEPATGLDVAGRERLLTALDALTATQPELSTVTVTHHLEDLPPTTCDVVLLSDGRVTAAGPIMSILTSESLSAAFDHPLQVDSIGGRWSVRSAR